jgi:thiol:disulfide interchange protein DsbA
MKNAFWIATAFLFLVACGEQESNEVSVEPEGSAEQQVVEDAVDDAADATAETADDTLEVVEESAAEPEEEEEEEQAILLARADDVAESQDWKFKEGTHFERLVPSQPTVGGADKIEVAEFFWYGCPHCYDFEPILRRWDAGKPANVRFVRIPATWNRLVELHARLFYTEEVLDRNGVIKDPDAFHEAVFQEYHRRGNRLTSEESIRRLFERFGVRPDEFERTWQSFEVDQKLRVARDLARRYSIASVPTMVVNGKYRTINASVENFSVLIEVIDELVARESLR